MDPPLEKTLASQPPVKYRKALPQTTGKPKPQYYETLVGVFKEYYNKDHAYPFSPPIQHTEPSTEISKRAEDTEYAELLNEAAQLPKGSIARLAKVVAYALSPYGACHADRVYKPVCSIPGETMEFVLPEKGVRYIGETTVDHGMVHFSFMEGRKWTLASEDRSRVRSWGPTLIFTPNWYLELRFEDGDRYSWQKVLTSAHNLAVGDLYVTHNGVMRVNQLGTGRMGVLKFKDPGVGAVTTKAKKKANRPVTGYIEDNGKKMTSPRFDGMWDSHLDLVNEAGKKTETLWTVNPLPTDDSKYKMTFHMYALMDIPKALKSVLPRTDTRFRKDFIYMDTGRWDEATEMKHNYEQATFARVKPMIKEKGFGFIQPKWFVKSPGHGQVKPGEGLGWKYNGRYWGARAEGFANVELADLY